MGVRFNVVGCAAGTTQGAIAPLVTLILSNANALREPVPLGFQVIQRSCTIACPTAAAGNTYV